MNIINEIKSDPKKLYLTAAISGLIALTLGRHYFNGPVCKIKKDLKGQVIIITGGNAGIGKETSLELARQGATIVIAARDIQRTTPVVQEIIQETGNKAVEVIRLDLSDFESIK